jgi:hypothetical protein
LDNVRDEEKAAGPAGDGDLDRTAFAGRIELLTAASAGWPIGIALGVVVIAVAAAIVISIVILAQRISAQARAAEQGLEVVREQTAELGGVERINDSGVRILHSARALRKAAVGK